MSFQVFERRMLELVELKGNKHANPNNIWELIKIGLAEIKNEKLEKWNCKIYTIMENWVNITAKFMLKDIGEKEVSAKV